MKIQNAETIQSSFTRVSQIKEQIEEVEEEVENEEVVIATLNGLPGSRNVCQKEVITFSKLWAQEEEARLIIREEKMGAIEDQDLVIQRRSLKKWGIWRTQFLNNLLSILSIWIRNDDVINEEDDEAERRSIPTKQVKITIHLSFYDIVFFYAFVYIKLMYYAW